MQFPTHPIRGSSGDLDLRLGFDLCDGEQEFLDKRKQVVSKALQQVLGLSEAPHCDQVWDGGARPRGAGTKSSLSPDRKPREQRRKEAGLFA
jgi:phospholipase A2